MKLLDKFMAFVSDDSATTATEYAIIASLLSIIIIAAVSGIGSTVNQSFSDVNSQLSS